jgi:hypothetical protein
VGSGFLTCASADGAIPKKTEPASAADTAIRTIVRCVMGVSGSGGIIAQLSAYLKLLRQETKIVA